MGGLFGVASREDCVTDLFFGTDYHSHLGTRIGGMVVYDGRDFNRSIHKIENAQFRAKFEEDLPSMSGRIGIGCISDTDAQPLVINSHIAQYSLCTVGKINNIAEIKDDLIRRHHYHFLQDTKQDFDNYTEVVSALLDLEDSFEAGIRRVRSTVKGSCSMLIMLPDRIIAARDLYGRTPLIIGRKDSGFCVTFESCALPNLGYTLCHELGPGEVAEITAEGFSVLEPPREKMRICSFLWVYYGYPASSYEGVNVEMMRCRNGELFAKRDKGVEADLVAGIPDSGIAHSIGYANASRLPYLRPFIKYTPTWSRSFMPQDQTVRNLVAKMKLMPIRELVDGKSLLLMEDSIVRGTQLRETIELLYGCNVRALHLRSACPPILFGCKYINFSASRSDDALIARQAIKSIAGDNADPKDFVDCHTCGHCAMVEYIQKALKLDDLKFQQLSDLVKAIGLPKSKLCTYCFDGKE